jgi:hypothetical protein
MAEPLDLAGLSCREDVELALGGSKPHGGRDLGPVAAKRREAHVAVPFEIADIGHAEISP